MLLPVLLPVKLLPVKLLPVMLLPAMPLRPATLPLPAATLRRTTWSPATRTLISKASPPTPTIRFRIWSLGFGCRRSQGRG
jgi:hypothetical protein